MGVNTDGRHVMGCPVGHQCRVPMGCAKYGKMKKKFWTVEVLKLPVGVLIVKKS